MAKGKRPRRTSAKGAPVSHAQRAVPVEFQVPDDVNILYADGTFITFSHGSFILSFVQTNHPLIVTDQDADKLDHVQSRCVARIALSPERLAATIDILQQHIIKMAEREKQQQEAMEAK